MSSNPPPSSQSDNPIPIDTQALIEYSRTVHEYTLQQWLQAVRVREERRRRLLLEAIRLDEYYLPQDSQRLQQQPTQTSSSVDTQPTPEEARNIPSPENPDKTP